MDLGFMVDLSKRYWLFNYNNFYPDGGLYDIFMTADTIEGLTNIQGYQIADGMPIIQFIRHDHCYIYDKINNERIEYPK